MVGTLWALFKIATFIALKLVWGTLCCPTVWKYKQVGIAIGLVITLGNFYTIKCYIKYVKQNCAESLTIWSHFRNGSLPVQALSALVNGLCRGNASRSSGSLNKTIACPAILPGMLLGGIGMRIIWSRCQWSITSTMLVTTWHWRVEILEMCRRSIGTRLRLWTATQRRHSRKVYILGSSTFLSISLIKVVLVCLEHHFCILFFWNFSNVKFKYIILQNINL